MSCSALLWRGILVSLAVAAFGFGQGQARGQGTSTTTTTSRGSSSGSSSSSSATQVGGGFTGGGSSPGGGYTGGGTNSSSSAGFTGGSGMTGNTGGRGTGGAGGSSTQVPTSANPLLSTYVNPYSAGMIDVTGKTTSNKAFGQAIYGLFSTSASTGSGTTGGGFTGGSGQFGATGGTTNTSGGVGYGYNTYGQTRTQNYVAVPGDTLPLVKHPSPQLQSNVSDLLSRTTSIKALDAFKITVNDQTVTITGTVGSAKERRIAEGMIRLTPGVRDVINNIVVSETLPDPKTGTTALDR